MASSDYDVCDRLVCRAGRECVDGECRCVASCPDHRTPVCGSNKRTYDNYCLMHRDACLTGQPISLRHEGRCRSDASGRQLKKTVKEEPLVCFGWERDSLRRQMLTYFRRHTRDQSWYRRGLKRSEKLWARFYVCDASKDDYLDTNEFLACLKDVPFSLRTSTIDNYLVKALCVDAIVDAGDTNSDWRLDFHEFQKLAEPNFQAKEKLCSLEGKKYEDGSQTKVDCNDCVCACGSWVCSSKTCDLINDIDDDDGDLADDLDADGYLDGEDMEDLVDEADADLRALVAKVLEIKEDNAEEDDWATDFEDDNEEEDEWDEGEWEDDEEEEDEEEEQEEEVVAKPKRTKNKKNKNKKKHYFDQ